MSDIISTINPPQVIRSTLAVGQGPAGPAGTPGGGGIYEHQQPVATTPWVVNHNFGYRPNVEAWSPGGVKYWAEVIHISANQAQVIFDTPTAGYAICS